MKRLSIILLLVTACGTTSGVGDIADIDTLTETYGCGHGFWVGNPDQTTALWFSYDSVDERPESVSLPHPDWTAELIDGRDLFANWCDDVIEEGEPVPQRGRTLPVVSGELEIVGEPPARFEGGLLTVRATDLVIDVGNGETHELGDIDIENPSWGFFAG